ERVHLRQLKGRAMSVADAFGRPLSRREALLRCANGFGAVALTSLLTDRAYCGALDDSPAANPLAPRGGHHPAKSTSVIFLYMHRGLSQVDRFDPKLRLDREDGQPIRIKARRRSSSRTTPSRRSCARRGNSNRAGRVASRSATCSPRSPSASTTCASSAR